MPQAFFNTLTILIGLCFGSFTNVIIYRVPRNESINLPPSHCPACDKRLSVRDLIPVLSWLFLRRRCRYCGVRISIRYPAVEAACAVLFICMAVYTGVSYSVIPLCMLAFMLLCVSVIDWDTQTIPDGLLLFGAAAGLIWVATGLPYAPGWKDALLGLLAGALPLFIIDRLTMLLIKKDGFGFGDVKLMAVCGLFLGWRLVLAAFFFAFITGGCYGAFLMLRRHAQRGDYMAFGPFLAIGTLAALWFGEAFIMLLFKW